MGQFQSTVRLVQTTGIVGDIINDGPRRAIPGRLNSGDAADNVVGRAFYHTAASDDQVQADGANTLQFAGILANSKNYALRGTTAGGTLAATTTLANGEQVELLQMGIIIVTLTTTANIGDNVYAADADGQLAAGTSAPANHTLVPNAKVVRRNITSAGDAIIQLTN